MNVCIFSGLLSWVNMKDEELLKAEAVAGIPDRVISQITETQVQMCTKHTL